MQLIDDLDAVVIGAGPAGASAAAVLAQQGHRVLVLEREQFPRYKVGESLIPWCWHPLNRLGMIDRLKQSQFTKKYSVQFVGMSGRVSQPFYFSQHTEHDCAQTWQVKRDEFDQMLLARATELGAQSMMNTTARGLLRDGEGAVVGVTAEHDGQPIQIRAKMTIDASGRDLFAVTRNNWRTQDPDLKKIAIWTYYENAKRDEGIDEGATTVAYIPEKGWFWYIPMHGNRVSVGVVAERDYLYRGERDPEAIFAREAHIQPWIREHLAVGRKVEACRVTGDYSYRARHCAEDGLVLAGDAFAFLDPVFSSGVFLALHSGIAAGDAVHQALEANDVSAAAFTQYGDDMCAAIEAMRKLVYAFYDDTFNFGQLLKKYPDLRTDLTDCLIGNLYKDFDPLFAAVAEFAAVPEPLKHGRPLLRQNTSNPVGQSANV